MNNFKLLIQYDGANYSGWQIQANAVSVQQKISDALNILLKEKVNLIGSGRTDTGVHAIAQTANFRYEGEIDIYRFKHSLNSLLPNDISVTFMEKVHEDFNARFDAKKRSYIYLITTGKTPLLNNYSYLYHGKINIEVLNSLSKYILGDHDFRSFSKKNTDIENTNCTIYSARWREIKGVTLFYIEANRFLHGLVRTITGTLLNLQNDIDPELRLEEIFTGLNRSLAGEAVPAKGLFLYKVKY
jgi:tRNA pseudouridine38-40 synthase